MPIIGDNAPLFELVDQDGKLHKLADYLGKWVVIYFYPKDDTPGCTTQACGIRDNWDQLKNLAVVLGISADNQLSHQKFASKYQLPYPILSDTGKSIVQAYGVWQTKKFMGREFMGIARTTFIVDLNGKIARIYNKVNPAGHASRLIDDLNELI